MKNKKVRKLMLNRETLRSLQSRGLQQVVGGATRVCQTAESECQACYTTDVTDCPGCIFSAACQSVGVCPSGVGTGCTCGC